jgi:F420-non-reducing hydrogenase small subunit
MAEKSVDVCLFNGAIRNEENEHMAHLLRAKSKIMIAYGSCAYEGCIPGLSNFYNRQLTFDRVYIETPSTENPKKIFPQTKVKVPEGELELPEFYDTVKTLAQTVDVDYFVPGCPPEEKTTWLALEALITGKLPPKGTVISHSIKAVCDECPLKKEEKKIKKFYRAYEKIPEPERCLLEQGFLCYGVATRGGCGALCPQANMRCTGCYGPVEGVIDQGAHFLSALSSIIDSNDPEEIQKIIDDIPDPAGTFYRYSLPDSLLRRAIVK